MMPDEDVLYVFKGARYATAGGRPPRCTGSAAGPVRPPPRRIARPPLLTERPGGHESDHAR